MWIFNNTFNIKEFNYWSWALKVEVLDIIDTSIFTAIISYNATENIAQCISLAYQFNLPRMSGVDEKQTHFLLWVLLK